MSDVLVQHDFLKKLGLRDVNSGAYDGAWAKSPAGGDLVSTSPVDGKPIATVQMASRADYDRVVERSVETFQRWRMEPAPLRGEYVRQIGNALREHKEALGKLVAWEMGKIQTEGEGEVQEMIDICDFAVGLSRQLYGKVMQSERPHHRMYEHWHPVGPVGTITAFNFPVAVWAWNAMIAAICGDTTIWKPSPSTPLCAVAVQNIVHKVMAGSGFESVFTLLVGEVSEVGQPLIEDRRVPIISATGSCAMGKIVGEATAKRFGRSILELGGNNALIVLDDADLAMTLPAVLFGAAGTAGQRCTSTRRLLLQKGIAPEFTKRLVKAYGSIRVGDPLDPNTLMGPVINKQTVEAYKNALETIKKQGGEILCGGKVLDRPGNFVEPTVVRIAADAKIVQQETFAPILYLIEFDTLDDAIAIQNGVPQGLSSAIFTSDVRNAERFLSAEGSDCGIANVNIGTSGAEIGGAFGGEKETGGGREAGSDSWKLYMRRQTTTINWGADLPLAQGVTFDV